MLDFIGGRSDDYYLGIEGFSLIGAFDVEALRGALSNVVERHDAIRSVFPEDRPVYRVLPMSSGLLDGLFLVTGGHASVEAARAAGMAWVGAPIALDEQPPLRFWVGEVGSATTVILIAGHHLVFDAWSFMLFYEDLTREYRRIKRAGEAPPRPPQYGEVQAGMGVPDLDGWSPLFRRDYAEIRKLQGRAVTRKGPAGAIRRTWSDFEGIAMTAKKHRVTPYVLGATALLLALSEILGTQEVIAGSAFAGRTTAASADAIGYFSTTLFFGADLTEVRDNSELIRHVDGQLRRWHSMPRIQWEPLLDRYDAVDLYPVKFAFLPINIASPSLPFDGVSSERLRPTPGTSARRPIDLISAYGKDTVAAYLIYRRDATDEGAAAHLLDAFAGALRALCGRTDR